MTIPELRQMYKELGALRNFANSCVPLQITALIMSKVGNQVAKVSRLAVHLSDDETTQEFISLCQFNGQFQSTSAPGALVSVGECCSRLMLLVELHATSQGA